MPQVSHDAKPTEQAHFDNPAPPHFVITNRHSPAFFGAGGRTRTVRVVHGCTIAVAQSRCTMQRPKRPHFDTPPHFHYHKQAFPCFLVLGANSHCAGKARMPYKMNAQSFKQGCLKSAALSCHTMWQPKRLTRHDAKPTEQARRARMHDSACPKFRTMRNQQSKHDSTPPPRHTFAHSMSGVTLFMCWWVGELALCG